MRSGTVECARLPQGPTGPPVAGSSERASTRHRRADGVVFFRLSAPAPPGQATSEMVTVASSETNPCGIERRGAIGGATRALAEATGLRRVPQTPRSRLRMFANIRSRRSDFEGMTQSAALRLQSNATLDATSGDGHPHPPQPLVKPRAARGSAQPGRTHIRAVILVQRPRRRHRDVVGALRRGCVDRSTAAVRWPALVRDRRSLR